MNNLHQPKCILDKNVLHYSEDEENVGALDLLTNQDSFTVFCLNE